MGLSLFKFVQWAPKDASSLQQSACRKRILMSNSRSRPFKAIHFATNYRPTRGSISPRNIAGLISEVYEEVAIQMTKNCRRRPPLSFDAPAKRNPANIPISPRCPETRMIGLHFCRRMYGSTFIHICAMGSKRRLFAATECWPKMGFDVK